MNARVFLATKIPKKLHLKVKILCVKENLTMESFIASALEEKLEKEKKKKALT